MPQIQFLSLEGLEAGRLYDDLTPPLTIGREEDNDIQLNDERVSRFHAKIQTDGEKFILTDLQSTNGTRVNGHPVTMRILRPGDLVMIGRCILLVGTDESPAQPKLASLDGAVPDEEDDEASVKSPVGDPHQVLDEAFPQGPPPAPTQLTPRQSAETADMLNFVRTELLQVLCTESEPDAQNGKQVRILRDAWQRMEQLVPHLNRYIQELTSPGDD
ncbi:MAG: FHA domain-containing protein [Planctomycetaceae bacterium]|nr:FHA domain-containing protein [Planctomycetaceae bacterium]